MKAARALSSFYICAWHSIASRADNNENQRWFTGMDRSSQRSSAFAHVTTERGRAGSEGLNWLASPQREQLLARRRAPARRWRSHVSVYDHKLRIGA